jgi:hypothetical protein
MRKSAPPPAFLAVILAGLALALTGCQDSPDPSGVEPPTGGGPQYEPALGPAEVWSNLAEALEHQDAFGWEDQLGAGFRYVPDSATATEYPAVDWAGWGRAQDVAVIENLAATADSVDADLRDVVYNAADPAGTEAQWDLIYDIRIWHVPGGLTRYRARALLDFALAETDWELVRWEDLQRESPEDQPQVLLPSFGVVRGALAPLGVSGAVGSAPVPASPARGADP